MFIEMSRLQRANTHCPVEFVITEYDGSKNCRFKINKLIYKKYFQDKSLSRKRVMPNEKNEAVVVETDSFGRSRNITYHATFDQVNKLLIQD